MMAIARPATAYDEMLEFLASTPTPQQIIAFRPSEATQARAHELLEANRSRPLSQAEQAELDEFSRVEHLMRMLKIKAREKVAGP